MRLTVHQIHVLQRMAAAGVVTGRDLDAICGGATVQSLRRRGLIEYDFRTLSWTLTPAGRTAATQEGR